MCTDCNSRLNLFALLYFVFSALSAVTIARAIEMKHSPSIVSALAYETAKMFTSAGWLSFTILS